MCRMHGGRAPQVQAAAAERLKALAGRAVDVLEDFLEDTESGALRLAAARDVLDRAGYKATEKVDLTSKGESFSFTIQGRHADA